MTPPSDSPQDGPADEGTNAGTNEGTNAGTNEGTESAEDEDARLRAERASRIHEVIDDIVSGSGAPHAANTPRDLSDQAAEMARGAQEASREHGPGKAAGEEDSGKEAEPDSDDS